MLDALVSPWSCLGALVGLALAVVVHWAASGDVDTVVGPLKTAARPATVGQNQTFGPRAESVDDQSFEQTLYSTFGRDFARGLLHASASDTSGRTARVAELLRR